MDRRRIDEIRARCEAATDGDTWPVNHPGKWYAVIDRNRKPVLHKIYADDGDRRFDICLVINASDADFIAHAREDIPALLDALEGANSVLAARASINRAYTATVDLDQHEIREIRADRDRWKARAKALEEAEKAGYIAACMKEVADGTCKLSESIADRDRWKARTAALEREIDELKIAVKGAYVIAGQAKQAIERAEALESGGWIPCSERMPDDDACDVLLTDGEEHYVGMWRCDARNWDSSNFGWIEANVTHWMPLPEAPKKAQYPNKCNGANP